VKLEIKRMGKGCHLLYTEAGHGLVHGYRRGRYES
jgi:hypothetical protein